MGNQTSESADMSPVMRKLVTCLTLADTSGKRRTPSMIHNAFSEQISKPEGSKINRSMSPFCPLDIQDQSNWITACFISPAMLIASPLYLCDRDGRLEKKLKVMPVNKGVVESLHVNDAIVIVKDDVCLLTLEEPYWKVGWAGISFINSIQDLRSENLKIVNHPERISSSNDDDEMMHVQVARKFILPKKASDTNPFAVQTSGITGSLICKIVNKKPYIVGVQASEYEAIFFSEKQFKLMNEEARKYMKQENRTEQFLKKLNIQEFEKETNW